MISVEWDNEEKTIIRWNYGNSWTVKDYVHGWHITLQMIHSISHSYDIIGIVPSLNVPLGLLPHIKRALESYAPDTLIVMVATNNVARELIRMLKMMFPGFTRNVCLAGTVDEARKMIAEYRASPESSPPATGK